MRNTYRQDASVEVGGNQLVDRRVVEGRRVAFEGDHPAVQHTHTLGDANREIDTLLDKQQSEPASTDPLRHLLPAGLGTALGADWTHAPSQRGRLQSASYTPSERLVFRLKTRHWRT